MKHCTTDKCPQILDSSCVFYEGPTLLFSGINTNDSVEVVIQKLNLKLESIPTVNLNNYYNKTEIDILFNNIDLSNYYTKNEVNTNLSTKLDKGTYTGTAQSLKNEIDNKQDILSSFDESILIETDGNIEGNVSLFEEYFEQQECELNFTPIQIVAIYQDGIKLLNSEYEIILPKKIKIKEYVDENIQIEYTHLKS